MAGRVLILAYFFPPVGGVGVQRTMKFTEHLPAVGWQPVVVAPRGARHRVMDPSLVDRLPLDLELHRALCVEPAGLRAAARWIFRTVGRRGGPAAEQSNAAGGDAGVAQSSPGWLRLMVDAAWRTWIRALFVPDEQVMWVPAAARTARRAHRRHAVDAIYSSSPPASTHLAAGVVKSLTGVPWVADFRDPWVANAFHRPPSWLHRTIDRWLERWVVTKADRAVFATPGLLRRFAERYPRHAARFTTIPNGYDRVALGPATVRRPGSTFHLVYAGSVYGDRELEIFLDGLELALGRRPALRDQLSVEFVGAMTAPNRRLADERARRLRPVLTVGGFVPHAEALRRVAGADAALILLAGGPDRDLFIGAKLFEAIGLDRQILAMVPQGDARAVLDELGWGVVADPTPTSVAEALVRLVDTPVADQHADPEGRYERARLTARLGALLDEVTGHGSAPGMKSSPTAPREPAPGPGTASSPDDSSPG